MNSNCYKIIFSKRLGTLVAVGEHTSATGKAASGQVSRGVVFPATALASMADGFVGVLRYGFVSVALSCLALNSTQAQSSLPQGGVVVAGAASISTQGVAMSINQVTDKASINWQSFSIGTGAAVNIAQPSASSVLLNRVVGNDPSHILGKLTANGQVILLNPNGVVFGKDGAVTASTFTASTFALSDADFMAGYYKYARNGSTASVVNQGTIETAAGGFVALIGATVTNEGTIRAPQGDVVLAAAESVTLPTDLVKPQTPATPNTVSVRMSKRVRLELDPAAINTAVNNTESGVIVTEGGQVLLQAAALSSAVANVTHSGRIDTSAPQAGAVTVLADHGLIKVDGSIKANISGNDGQGQARQGADIIIGRDIDTGVLAKATDVSNAKLESQGGFVETSGDYLKTAGISIKAKDWLLDPTDINIVATGTATPDTPSISAGGTTTYQETAGINTSEVLKSTIESAINGGTNVIITTANPTAGANGAGNITLSTALSFSNTGATDATLTLLARNGITQNSGASITTNSATSTKLVNVVMTSEGSYMGNAAASASSQGMSLGSTITTNGNITLTATNNNTGGGAGISFANGAGLKANTVTVTGVKLGTAGMGYGVLFNGTNVLESTGATASVINGTSLSQATAYTYGTTISDAANVTFKTATNGSMVVKGSNAAWETGLRISGGYNTSTRVTTEGNITLGALEDKSQFSMRSGSIVANSGSLKIYGQMSGGGTAVSTYDGSAITANNGVSLEIQGVATNNATGVGLGQNSPIAITTNGGGNITITGSTATGNNAFVTGASTIDSSGTLTITGTATASSGAGLNVNSASSILRAVGNISLTGSAIGNSGFYNAGAITSTTGSISINGTSSTNIATNMQGVISANNNLTITGTNTSAANTNQAVFFNKSATSVTGIIDISANTSGSTLLATQLASGGSLNTTNNSITLNTDSIDINATGGTVNAGTGTVAIKNKSAGVAINVGGSDVGNTSAASRTLSLSQAELNQITAANLTFGSALAGNITVSGATTTNATTGNIALQTAGNIAVSSALTVGGASATKALTLNATGANSAITQSAAIKSTGLELLGANATYTVTNTGNDIKKIAGNTKQVSLTNNSAFAVDTVNTVGLTTSGNTTFSSTAAVTENQKLDTAGLELLGVGGSYTLTNTGNNVRKIAGNTGSVNLTNNSAFAIDSVNSVGLTTTGNTTLRSTSAVTQTQKVAASGLELLGTGGTYTLANAANSITTLAANTGALSFVNSDNFTVGLVNTSGITTTSGDITLVSANGINVSRNITSNGNDIAITANGNGGSSKGFEQSAGTINAGAGDVTIVGITKTSTGWPNRIGANVRSIITGNNISITGTSDTSTATDGMGVQFEGASSVSATATLTVTGEVKGGGTGRAVVIGNGMSTPTLLSGATGIDITGTLSSANAGSADNAGVFIEASGVTATSSGGAINITGDSTAAGAAFSKNALFLKYAMNLAAQNGTTIEGTSVGTGASVHLDPEANINVTNGALTIQTGGNSASNAFIMSGANARITQATNAGVTLSTEGQGNITAPKIVNSGTGNVVVAAGRAIAAGTGTGGQVMTLASNSITQSSTGKTYIYSGQASSTGVLSNLTSDFGTLFYQGSSNAVNAGFNKTYDGTPANDLTAPAGGSVSSGAQVFFRSTTKPGFTLTLNDLSKQYGDVDPTVFVATGSVTTLTNAYAGTGGNNNFAVAVSDVIPALTGPRNAGENVGAYAYVLDGSSMNTSLSAQPNLNIAKRDITLTSVTAASKQYDGGTTATINGGVFANTANGETLSLSGAGVFADPNAAVGKPVSVTDVTTLGLVDGTGVWSNYNLTSTGSASGIGNITKAPLTLTVNNSAVFVTQLASGAPNNGYSYTGFLNGDDASVFNSLPTRTYTGAASYPVAGTYNGVLSTSAVPTSTNYLVSVVPGNLTVTPADKLLITIGSQSVAYGSQSGASAGVAGAGTVTAQYCFVSNNCNAPNLVDLTLTQLSALQWKAADNTGSYVVFDTSVTGAQASGGGYLKVGNYAYTASEIAPLSLPNGNFSGRATNAGVLTVTPLAVSLASVPVSKAFDSTTALPAAILPNTTLTASNKLSGDTVDASFVSGAYASSAASSAASFNLLGVQLSGADATNYSLTNYGNNRYTGTGAITGGSSSASNQAIVVPPKPIIPSDNTSGGGESGGSSAGNPYLVIPSNRPNSADRCTPNTLEDCLCETQEPQPLEGLAICYQPKKTANNALVKGRRG